MSRPLLTSRERVELADGRGLVFSVTGRAGDLPVLYLPGAIGSPLELAPRLLEAIERLRLRFVVVERPGFGGSDPLPGRKVADFARDVEELADGAGFRRFAVIGVSSGGPYALACRWWMPDRVAAAAAVSTVLPGHPPHSTRGTSWRYRSSLSILHRYPRATIRIIDGGIPILLRHPRLVGRLVASGATDGDDTALARPGVREAAVKRLALAAERGATPSVEEYGICTRDWGFELADLEGGYELWHGELDRLVPLSVIRQLAREVPGLPVRIDPGGGHFFFRDRLDEIMTSLAEAARRDDSAAGPPLELAA